MGFWIRKTDFRGRKGLADYTDRIWCRNQVPSYPAGNKGFVTSVQAAAAWAQNAPQEQPAADQATTVVQEAPAAPSPSVAAASVRFCYALYHFLCTTVHPAFIVLVFAYNRFVLLRSCAMPSWLTICFVRPCQQP